MKLLSSIPLKCCTVCCLKEQLPKKMEKKKCNLHFGLCVEYDFNDFCTTNVIMEMIVFLIIVFVSMSVTVGL